MARLEVYFQNGRCAKFDPAKVTFTNRPYTPVDAFGQPTELAQFLIAGGAVVNSSAVCFIRLESEEDDA